MTVTLNLDTVSCLVFANARREGLEVIAQNANPWWVVSMVDARGTYQILANVSPDILELSVTNLTAPAPP